MDKTNDNDIYIEIENNDTNTNKLNVNSNNFKPINNKYKNIKFLNEELTTKLPDNWSRNIYNNKFYYSCHTTKHTQWLHPLIPIGTIMSNGLPYGWEKDDFNGTIYYINHIDCYNTLLHPAYIINCEDNNDNEDTNLKWDNVITKDNKIITTI
jgi:hypothetical protein